MVNDCDKSCEAKNILAGKQNFSLNKAKREKRNFFVESLDQCRHLEVRQKARNDEPKSVGPQGVTQHRSHLHQVFVDFARIFSLFSLISRTSNFWCLRNLIKQLFHSRLLDMRLVIGYLPSHIQRTLME